MIYFLSDINPSCHPKVSSGSLETPVIRHARLPSHNVPSDHEITIIDLAKVKIQMTSPSSQITHLPALKKDDMTRRQLDTTQMCELLLAYEQGIRLVLDARKV